MLTNGVGVLTFETCLSIVTVYRDNIPYRAIYFDTPRSARQFVKKREENPKLSWHTQEIAKYRQVLKTVILQHPDGRMNY